MAEKHDDKGSIAKLDVRVAFDPDHGAQRDFVGHAELRRLTTNGEVRVAHVAFDVGATTRWHHHHGPQLLWFTAGDGEVSTREGVILRCRSGDLVRIDPNVDHRHGAAEGFTAEHIAITDGTTFWQETESLKA